MAHFTDDMLDLLLIVKVYNDIFNEPQGLLISREDPKGIVSSLVDLDDDKPLEKVVGSDSSVSVSTTRVNLQEENLTVKQVSEKVRVFPGSKTRMLGATFVDIDPMDSSIKLPPVLPGDSNRCTQVIPMNQLGI